MFKSIAKKLVALYLLPLKINPRLFYFVKGTHFMTGAEHLYSAMRYIKGRGNIPEDSVIIDVGGFNGGTSLYFADEFKGAQIYCVEPNPKMSRLLDEMESKHKNISVRKLALGRTRGEAVLHITSNDMSSSLNELNTEEISRTPSSLQANMKEETEAQVKVSTLDDEFRDCPQVLLIKLDTQGTELEILRGGIETLKKSRFVLSEMNNHELYKNTCQYYEMDEFLRSQSFRLADLVVSYRGDDGVTEYDALYENIGR